MGSNSDKFFWGVCSFFDEGKEDPNSTKNRPSWARQRNAIKWRFAGGPMMANAFCWWANDGPTLSAGLVALGTEQYC